MDFFAAMRAKQAVGRHVAFALIANHGFILVTGDILAPFNFDRRQMTAFGARSLGGGFACGLRFSLSRSSVVLAEVVLHPALDVR